MHCDPGISTAGSKVSFESIRSLHWQGYGLKSAFIGEVATRGGHVYLTLDGSEYAFSAQQSTEISKNLLQTFGIYAKLGVLQPDDEQKDLWGGCEIWQQIMAKRLGSTSLPSMHVFTGETHGWEFVASADFERPDNPSSGSRYHRVCIALDEEISLPCISIDNRAFAFSIVDALWLIENLQIAGYLAAMADE